jgi:gliding motility-associated-like protein
LKKLFLIYSTLLLLVPAFAQKQANNWYFGFKAGLDFNQVPAQRLNNTGIATSFEGMSGISDNNGRLLFYTNGITVINKQFARMKNGTSLGGHQSSTNACVVVPLPSNDSIYYIFTTGAAMQETHQFQYSIVNINGDAGLGEVTVKGSIIEDTIFEKMAAIRHCNKRDVWVVIHKWGTDEYHSYLVTSSGINLTPIISHTGLVINGVENNEIGTLKFSSKGNKLAAVHAFQNDAVELMDFDNTTGIISNPIVFYPNAGLRELSYTGVYGAEFSPNGNLLYISSSNAVTQPSVLYQFNITSNNAATITATKQIIANTTPWYAGALQLGPDNKIYMAMWKDTSISVIENPDVYGAGCNFNFNKIYMGKVSDEPVQFGLPIFIQSYFDPLSNPYDFTRTSSCKDTAVTFTLDRLSGIDSVKWNFGDNQQSQVLQPVHNYAAAGFYNVQLIVYKIDCSGLNDTITRKIWITGSSNLLGKDTSACDQLQLQLGIDDIFGANYLWNTGAVTSKINTTVNALYWLEVEQNGCKVRDSINVTTKPKPFVNIGADTAICFNDKVVLKADITNADKYLWSTGETTTAITIDKIGTYYLTITQNLCVASDTLKVQAGDCAIFIPNAFTPNNDGVNDYFKVLGTIITQTFSMKIYDRYGHVIFSTNNILDKWDGKFKGKNLPVGNYPWQVIYINAQGYTKRLKGTVLILH